MARIELNRLAYYGISLGKRLVILVKSLRQQHRIKRTVRSAVHILHLNTTKHRECRIRTLIHKSLHIRKGLPNFRWATRRHTEERHYTKN
ncbi:hypothetical protein [uncultured Duncaniella sp.]|uniref:hypothetical protein n=1 Tax=uncultured Duncaniella sp. TaxID=2768039 RepID=UPI00260D28B2|nr:hypothetical protein [uncultured Duncaniella sp.]